MDDEERGRWTFVVVVYFSFERSPSYFVIRQHEFVSSNVPRFVRRTNNRLLAITRRRPTRLLPTVARIVVRNTRTRCYYSKLLYGRQSPGGFNRTSLRRFYYTVYVYFIDNLIVSDCADASLSVPTSDSGRNYRSRSLFIYYASRHEFARFSIRSYARVTANNNKRVLLTGTSKNRLW